MCRWRHRTISLLMLTLTLALPAAAHARDAAELRLALRKLAVVGGALYVAAHPDDENTALLAWFANERLLRTAYLSMTRGGGGQNLIGDEKGALLGLVRTQELLAARRIDGAEQRFTRAVDFGYSKSPEETLAVWGHDEILADVVWTIRRFQPDVLVTRFPVTGEGGHGHHTASAMLAEEAFAAAGDPARFPEQLEHVAVWQPRRIFWNRFSWRPVAPDDPSVADSLRVDLGAYNELLGRAYTEIAAESRSQHKSQGFGSAERRGVNFNYFDLRGGEPASTDLLEGVDTSWARHPGGEAVGALLERAAAAFDADRPAASVPALLEALAALDRLRGAPGWTAVERPWLEDKRSDLLAAIRDCAGIAIDVDAERATAVPGSTLPVTVTVVNRSAHPFRLAAVSSPFGAAATAGAPLADNVPVEAQLELAIPADQPYSRPYWLERPPADGRYVVDASELRGLAEAPAALAVEVVLESPGAGPLRYRVPVTYRWTDRVAGGQSRAVDVVPPVAIDFGAEVDLFPSAEPQPVAVRLRSFAPARGELRLELPADWRVEPGTVPVELAAAGEEASASFRVTPPAGAALAELGATLQLEGGGAPVIAQAVIEIDYPHLPARRVVAPASARAVRADVRRRGDAIGYVLGSGDDVPEILRQAGYRVELLSDADLDRGDFSSYDAIVTGIRAYNTRPRLAQAHEALMRWVERGGTVVVQYNTRDLLLPVPGPRPFEISRDRVTREDAPVRLLDPDDPLLSTPNRITAADFEGWVQERGLYFASEWDPSYRTMLSSGDPGEAELAGGQLALRHGEGIFVYTSYSWWRQLAAGVPGAIRAFVNLVSAE